MYFHEPPRDTYVQFTLAVDQYVNEPTMAAAGSMLDSCLRHLEKLTPDTIEYSVCEFTAISLLATLYWTNLDALPSDFDAQVEALQRHSLPYCEDRHEAVRVAADVAAAEAPALFRACADAICYGHRVFIDVEPSLPDVQVFTLLLPLVTKALDLAPLYLPSLPAQLLPQLFLYVLSAVARVVTAAAAPAPAAAVVAAAGAAAKQAGDVFLSRLVTHISGGLDEDVAFIGYGTFASCFRLAFSDAGCNPQKLAEFMLSIYPMLDEDIIASLCTVVRALPAAFKTTAAPCAPATQAVFTCTSCCTPEHEHTHHYTIVGDTAVTTELPIVHTLRALARGVEPTLRGSQALGPAPAPAAAAAAAAVGVLRILGEDVTDVRVTLITADDFEVANQVISVFPELCDIFIPTFPALTPAPAPAPALCPAIRFCGLASASIHKNAAKLFLLDLISMLNLRALPPLTTPCYARAWSTVAALVKAVACYSDLAVTSASAIWMGDFSVFENPLLIFNTKASPASKKHATQIAADLAQALAALAAVSLTNPVLALPVLTVFSSVAPGFFALTSIFRDCIFAIESGSQSILSTIVHLAEAATCPASTTYWRHMLTLFARFIPATAPITIYDTGAANVAGTVATAATCAYGTLQPDVARAATVVCTALLNTHEDTPVSPEYYQAVALEALAKLDKNAADDMCLQRLQNSRYPAVAARAYLYKIKNDTISADSLATFISDLTNQINHYTVGTAHPALYALNNNNTYSHEDQIVDAIRLLTPLATTVPAPTHELLAQGLVLSTCPNAVVRYCESNTALARATYQIAASLAAKFTLRPHALGDLSAVVAAQPDLQPVDSYDSAVERVEKLYAACTGEFDAVHVCDLLVGIADLYSLPVNLQVGLVKASVAALHQHYNSDFNDRKVFTTMRAISRILASLLGSVSAFDHDLFAQSFNIIIDIVDRALAPALTATPLSPYQLSIGAIYLRLAGCFPAPAPGTYDRSAAAAAALLSAVTSALANTRYSSVVCVDGRPCEWLQMLGLDVPSSDSRVCESDSTVFTLDIGYFSRDTCLLAASALLDAVDSALFACRCTNDQPLFGLYDNYAKEIWAISTIPISILGELASIVKSCPIYSDTDRQTTLQKINAVFTENATAIRNQVLRFSAPATLLPSSTNSYDITGDQTHAAVIGTLLSSVYNKINKK